MKGKNHKIVKNWQCQITGQHKKSLIILEADKLNECTRMHKNKRSFENIKTFYTVMRNRYKGQ